MVAGVLQAPTAPPEATEVASVDPKSIAVLPCADRSAAGDQAHFAYGIAEELLNLLAKFDDLTVTSRTSSFRVSDAGLSVPQIAAQLGVAYVLEGSLRKAGEKIRVTAQLMRPGRMRTCGRKLTIEIWTIYSQSRTRSRQRSRRC
jgi:adenylate cyclase